MNEKALNDCGLSIEMLEALSYESQLSLSLKRSLRHFDKEALFKDIENALEWFDKEGINNDMRKNLEIDYRVKSLNSVQLKYDRYYPDRPAAKAFNDLLGFRCICKDYASILSSVNIKPFRVVDMSQGKANDDGYRGVHVYYQKSNHHYPIEVQYNTVFDRRFNDWLHSHLYKKTKNEKIGQTLRLLYENGKINSAKEFKEVLNDVLSRSN